MVNGLVGDDAGGGGACGLGDREPVSLVRLPPLTANSPTPPQARTGVHPNSLNAPPGAMEEWEIIPDAVLTVNRNGPAGLISAQHGAIWRSANGGPVTGDSVPSGESVNAAPDLPCFRTRGASRSAFLARTAIRTGLHGISFICCPWLSRWKSAGASALRPETAHKPPDPIWHTCQVSLRPQQLHTVKADSSAGLPLITYPARTPDKMDRSANASAAANSGWRCRTIRPGRS
jgi:hypothetical protein